MAKLLVYVMDSSGRPLGAALGLVGEAVLGTRAGGLDGLRGLAGVAAVVAGLLWTRRVAVPLAGGAVLATMVTLALSGHAWTATVPAVAVPADVIHHAAAATWIEGVVALALVLAPNEGGADEDTAWAVRRFSVMVLCAVAVVTLSGIVSALMQSGMTPSTLLSTRYGTTLIVKLALVALVIGLGWWQRSRLLATVTASGRLFRTARGEVVVAGLVLATTALLVDTVPAREALASKSFEATVDDGAGTVSVLVTPVQAGDNVIHLTFFDQVGSPRSVDVASARVAYGDLPPRQVELEPLAASHWVAMSATLPSPGTWTITVDTLGRSQETQFSFELDVRDPAG